MDYDKVKIGKVKYYDNHKGVGEIVSIDSSYLVTVDDISGHEIKAGDVVKFRGEMVNDINKAFFVSKIENEYNVERGYLKSKIFPTGNKQ